MKKRRETCEEYILTHMHCVCRAHNAFPTQRKLLIVLCYLHVQRIFFLLMSTTKCAAELSEGIHCYLEEFPDLEHYWDWNQSPRVSSPGSWVTEKTFIVIHHKFVELSQPITLVFSEAIREAGPSFCVQNLFVFPW